MNHKTVEVAEYLLKSRSVRWRTTYDEKNFLYCVIRHLWPATENIRRYAQFPAKYMRKFDLNGITFPLNFKQINKFVKKNNHLPLTIRVFFESEEEICVLDTFSNIRDKRKKYKNTLNLLLLKSDPSMPLRDDESIPSSISTLKDLEQQHHFFTIRNIRSFLNSRKKNLWKASNEPKHYYCEVCLMNFTSKRKKDSHHELCQEDKQSVFYPEKGSTLNFSNQKNCFKAPVIGFADFECYMEKDAMQEEKVCKKCNKNSLKCDCEKSSSRVLNTHKACGYSVCFVDSENDVFYQETYSGDDAVEVFLLKLPDYGEIVNNRKQRFRKTSQIVASDEDWEKYREATICHICEKKFINTSRSYKKVVDHDHVSGSIIQAAHAICNLQRQGPFLTPIYFHNGQG